LNRWKVYTGGHVLTPGIYRHDIEKNAVSHSLGLEDGSAVFTVVQNSYLACFIGNGTYEGTSGISNCGCQARTDGSNEPFNYQQAGIPKFAAGAALRTAILTPGLTSETLTKGETLPTWCRYTLYKLDSDS
jgi:hypothetical protein